MQVRFCILKFLLVTAVEQLKIGNVLFNDVLSTVYLWLYASLEIKSFGVPDTMSCTNQFMPDNDRDWLLISGLGYMVSDIKVKDHSGDEREREEAHYHHLMG